MESLNHVSLFSWLKEEQTLTFNAQTLSISRHLESELPNGAVRYRCVYSEQSVESELARLLVVLSQPVSLAYIVRKNALHCIELRLDKPLNATEREQYALIDGVEFFSISPNQAVLNRCGLLVMDMDSTAIEIECIDELAVMAGVGEAVAEVTERAMQGELDFEESLRARVAQLEGADEAIIQILCDKLPLMPGLTEMVAELQSYGWRLVVASGGFTPFVGHLKQLLDLDAAYANELVFEGGKLTGQVTGQVVDAQFKADTVVRCAQAWEIPKGQRLAIGDGANDIPMIEIADFGIAYHAKPKLEAAADVAIKQLDLKVLPYLLQLI
ncbi:phosphoserine phosphatase SerB [Shewanella nanhaiensis]|uniref:Phosphoserine phosphatase n=1 Tax=Shewanella nanhaiensis TaxID=2864872 RepID=A0ABS7E895_9GAMM|nr:phosphoserine phosphatase SerB [Shewanella nanhaiensis]MBW8185794.1 phosphoserine phosphatase SerB [Shewanella nanhaiensis]